MESKSEKRLRYMLIVIFVSITAGAFFYKYSGFGQEQEKKYPLAVVIQETSKDNENPIVVLYDYKDKQHILVQYEIEINNGFHFHALEALQLKNAPTMLARDAASGVWVKVEDEWRYFNQSLEEVSRSIENKIPPSSIPFIEEQDGNEKWIVLQDERKIKVENNEVVKSVMSLSTDGELLFILTNDGVKISTIKMK